MLKNAKKAAALTKSADSLSDIDLYRKTIDELVQIRKRRLPPESNEPLRGAGYGRNLRMGHHMGWFAEGARAVPELGSAVKLPDPPVASANMCAATASMIRLFSAAY